MSCLLHQPHDYYEPLWYWSVANDHCATWFSDLEIHPGQTYFRRTPLLADQVRCNLHELFDNFDVSTAKDSQCLIRLSVHSKNWRWTLRVPFGAPNDWLRKTGTRSKKIKLENVAINDVFPLKAARRDATANLKCFGPRAPETKFRLLHLHSLCGTTLFGSHKRHLFPPIWQRSVGFGFRVQRVRSTMQNLRRVGENTDHILSRLWTKVHEIFRRCRNSLALSNALFRLSVSRFVQKIFTIKSRSRRKTEQMQKFCGPQFCGRDGSDFCTAVC